MDKITQEEYDESVRLYQIATTTPVITSSVGEKTLSEIAWDEFNTFNETLGKKYRYDADTHGITPSLDIVPM